MTSQITPELRRALAAKVGVHEQYLYQCLTGRRDMNPTEARRIEDATKGQLTRQMLCQRTWLGIWPELAKQRKAKQPASA
jgi:DNA-binding transcriptional regulator YdaS (Cro superfamily)